jgi:hypothetical protein
MADIAKTIKVNSNAIEVMEVRETRLVRGLGPIMLFSNREPSNSLEGARLEVEIYDRMPRGVPGFSIPIWEDDAPTRLTSERFEYDLFPPGQAGFLDSRGSQLSEDDLAARLLTDYMDAAKTMKSRSR